MFPKENAGGDEKAGMAKGCNCLPLKRIFSLATEKNLLEHCVFVQVVTKFGQSCERCEPLVKVSEALAPVAASGAPGLCTMALGGLFHRGSACHRLWDAYGALLIILEMMSLSL